MMLSDNLSDLNKLNYGEDRKFLSAHACIITLENNYTAERLDYQHVSAAAVLQNDMEHSGGGVRGPWPPGGIFENRAWNGAFSEHLFNIL